MDWLGLAFYAVICGVLSVAAPQLGAFHWRLGIGAVVGMIAASILPILRGTGY